LLVAVVQFVDVYISMWRFLVVDDRAKGRMRGLLGGRSPDDVPIVSEPLEPPSPESERQALQVLVLAQRTADEHIANAQRQADTIRTNARTAAEQTVRESAAQADGIRRDAEKVISDARAAALETVRQAQARAADLEKEAQRQFDERVGSLAAQRAELQKQLAELKQFDKDYRDRLRKFMHSQLRAIDADERLTDIMEGPQVLVATDD
jgi:hypothetical protein